MTEDKREESMANVPKEKEPGLRWIYRETLIRLNMVERDKDYNDAEYLALLKELKGYIDMKIYAMEQNLSGNKTDS
jgi:hypothetical protein